MATANAKQQHRSALKKYLQMRSTSRQTEDVNRASTSVSNLKNSAHKGQMSCQTMQSRKGTRSNTTKPPYLFSSVGKSKLTIESLPNEVLLLIFWKLKVGDLIRASQVCHRWHRVASDNLLWKKIYARFAGPPSNEKEDEMQVQELELGCWKNLCLWRCRKKRDLMYFKKWKHPDPYTGLKHRPEQTLSNMGVIFELNFLNSENLLCTMQHSDICWSTMSVSVRWYGLVHPPVKDINCIHVHACSPLMFYGPSKPVKDGFMQRSLLMDYKGHIGEVLSSQNALGYDAQIQLYEATGGLIVAKYQADGEVAFVMCTFHFHNLIYRCLKGSPNRQWLPPECLHPADDVDPDYGLHGYSCVILLRTMRQKCLECKFSHMHTDRHALTDGFATFRLVKKDDKMSHVSCLREINLPWKTNLFKGIVQDVGILDITLLDQCGEPFWVISTAVAMEKCSQTNQFEFHPDTYRAINYQDNIGKLCLEIGKLSDGIQYLSFASLSLSVPAINKAFKCSY